VSILNSINNKIKDRLRNTIRVEVENELQWRVPQLLSFQQSKQEDRQSFHDHTKAPKQYALLYENLRQRCEKSGMIVETLNIDIDDFESWLQEFPELKNAYKNMGEAYIEKCLEHYLSHSLLNLQKNDTFIDIAAAGSPYPDALNKRGVTSYRLDLAYPAGIHGKTIGADAGDMKLPAGFATAMALHCAYECFMGDADVRFVKEAGRILRRGRYIIIPLYLDETYFVATSPYCNQKNIIIEPEAKKTWRDDPYKVPFSRHYSTDVFKTRIYDAVPPGMTKKIYFVANLIDVMERYQDQRIYCFFLFYCEKEST
jgi:hypothetical protein